jgi:hypothetical protein
VHELGVAHYICLTIRRQTVQTMHFPHRQLLVFDEKLDRAVRAESLTAPRDTTVI